MTKFKIFGNPDERTLAQLYRSAQHAEHAVLCADAHVGYGHPIGGAIAYPEHISVTGCGVDLGCGNKAVRTPVRAADVEFVSVMTEIKDKISFGLGRANQESADDAVLAQIAHSPFAPQRNLLRLAQDQLGTVGGGNHYVDLFEDEDGFLWVGVHFGSRGFGHKTAIGFLALAQGKQFTDHASEGGMDVDPVLLPVASELGQDYIAAMTIACDYAYAGRNWVVARVLKILGTQAVEEVHNHHNFAAQEAFGWVVRKGCTQAYPGQLGFVGGSMGDISVILEGRESPASKEALYTTIHGAGRIMSRTQAKGRWRGRKRLSKGLVDWDASYRALKEKGIVVRGGDADEAPEVYRKLDEALAPHLAEETVLVRHTLRVRGVAMASGREYDPYKD